MASARPGPAAAGAQFQSANEELTASNRWLQETLKRQRMAVDALQHVVYSTGVAILFLDAELRVRFFTPAAESLLSISQSDVGRPIADLRAVTGDEQLEADARKVLQDQAVMDREVAAPTGRWTRRVSPCRTHGDAVEGVVITLFDTTERRRGEQALARPSVPRRDWPTAPGPGQSSGPGVVFLVDDDGHIRAAARALLEDSGLTVRCFQSMEAFQAVRRHDGEGCLLLDGCLPGISGIELLRRLRAAGDPLPAILMTGCSDVPMAVEAMKAGAADFIEKPISGPDLLGKVRRALEQSRHACKLQGWREDAKRRIASLTPRQGSIMELVLAGQPNKNIAADLGISQRTVETHRAAIMRRTGVRSLPALARLAVAASGSPAEDRNFMRSP